MENRNQTIKACIFDFDGILVDSEIISVKAWGKAAADFGYTLTKKHFEPCLGKTLASIKEVQLGQFGPDFPFEAIHEKEIVYFRELLAEEGLPLIDGVLEVHKFLTEQGVKTAVASSTYKQEVLYRMERAGIPGLFDYIIAGDEIKNSKPAPDIFLKAAETLNVKPGECIVLEDSENGVLSGSNAGMHVFVVKNMAPITDTVKERADAVFDSHATLLSHLKEIFPTAG